MANNQFQFPKSYSESDIRAQLDAIQYAPVNPEQQRAPYQGIKDIENKIFSYREAALAMNKKAKHSWISSLVLKPQTMTIRDLVEEESKLGGEMFGKGHRFWLDNKSNSTVFRNEIADWYHTQPNPDDPSKPIVLRFQTTPEKIFKLYEGREYAPTIQDVEIFTKAIENYTKAVLPLYPLDQMIDELEQSDLEFEATDNDSFGLAA